MFVSVYDKLAAAGGQQCDERAYCGAGVLEIQAGALYRKRAGGSLNRHDGFRIPLYVNAEARQRAEENLDIVGIRDIFNPRFSPADRGEEEGAVRDRLRPGNPYGARESALALDVNRVRAGDFGTVCPDVK